MEFEPHQGKLEETVIQILKGADLDIATELVVRREAERLLGIDLSDIASKQLVRRVVESFLLSTSPVDEVREGTEQVEKSPVDNQKVASDDDGGRVICKLPGMMRVSVTKFKRTKLLSIREYYQKEGMVFPSGRGITLNPKEWSSFCSGLNDIEEAITKMESRIRLEGIGKEQTEAEPSNPSTCEADALEKQVQNIPPRPLIPIATTRFTGRNYYCWKRQMEFFLNQLKVSYVLIEPCPKWTPPASASLSLSLEEATKSHAQKWMNDDYICRHSILNSLSDQLFDQYSIKPLNAREIWEELKSLYDDDFGTKRCQVNNYLQFQMIDGVSVLEQVEQLHRIAGAVTASGIRIDENFHTSAIISKLPPSWKNVRAKLMRQEYLPLDKLIYLLKDEEVSTSQHRWSKRNDMRGLCFGCHKEGHIRRDCPLNRRPQNHEAQS